MRAVTLTDDVESKDGLDFAMDARRHIAQTEAGQFDAILAYLDAVGAEPLAQNARSDEWTRYGGSGTPAVSEFVAAESNHPHPAYGYGPHPTAEPTSSPAAPPRNSPAAPNAPHLVDENTTPPNTGTTSWREQAYPTL